MGRYLTRTGSQAFYDRLGRFQDWNRFYEARAFKELEKYGAFETAASVFELGCGTGAFALRLLSGRLNKGASYVGADISPRMISLASRKLSDFPNARVMLTRGSLKFDLPDGSFDRFVSTYVLDLLPPHDIKEALAEAHRLLEEGGRICLLSLTFGQTLVSRFVCGVWAGVETLRPSLVGGCRPVELLDYLDLSLWRIVHGDVVNSFGVPSEVLVAVKR